MDASSHRHFILDSRLLESVPRRVKDSYLSGIIHSDNFVLGELDREPFLFPSDSRFLKGSCSFLHTLLESTCLSSSIVCNLQYFVFLCSSSCPRQQRQRRTFRVVFHEKRNASHEFSAPSIIPLCFSVWCSLAIHPFEQYLERTATATACAAPAVADDDSTTCPDFFRRVASSCRWWCRPIAY